VAATASRAQVNIAEAVASWRDPLCRGVDKMGQSLAFIPALRIFFGVMYGLIPPEANVAEFVTVDNSEMECPKNKKQFEAINGLTCLKITRVAKLVENLSMTLPKDRSAGKYFCERMRKTYNRVPFEAVKCIINWETTGGLKAGTCRGTITEETEIYVYHSLIQPHLPVSGALSLLRGSYVQMEAARNATEESDDE
jgi:hypothetical protein